MHNERLGTKKSNNKRKRKKERKKITTIFNSLFDNYASFLHFQHDILSNTTYLHIDYNEDIHDLLFYKWNMLLGFHIIWNPSPVGQEWDS
jgi:hypothetical protein